MPLSMTVSEMRERWSRMLAQAEHLAARDQTADAVARVKACIADVEAARSRSPVGAGEDIDRIRRQALRALERAEAAHADWKARVEDRARRHVEDEQADYASPLRVPATD